MRLPGNRTYLDSITLDLTRVARTYAEFTMWGGCISGSPLRGSKMRIAGKKPKMRSRLDHSLELVMHTTCEVPGTWVLWYATKLRRCGKKSWVQVTNVLRLIHGNAKGRRGEFRVKGCGCGHRWSLGKICEDRFT